MIKYSLILIFLSISIRYAYLLYKGRIDFSKFTKKTESSPIYTSDLSGLMLSTINSRAYLQFIILFICWPLFCIRNPHSFVMQLCTIKKEESKEIDQKDTPESDMNE